MVARTPAAIFELRAMSRLQSEKQSAQAIATNEGIGKLQAQVVELASDTVNESALVRRYVASLGRGVSNLYEALMGIKKLLAM